jgi:hypothetical protein
MRIDDGCFHGGAFFTDVGEDFRDLWRRERIVNADVLDAWFAPAPGALAAIRDHLDWLGCDRLSPPRAPCPSHACCPMPDPARSSSWRCASG